MISSGQSSIQSAVVAVKAESREINTERLLVVGPQGAHISRIREEDSPKRLAAVTLEGIDNR